MAQIEFTGICSGTEERVSKSKGTTYKITKFVEVPSLSSFEIFGDLGLPAEATPRKYTIEAEITGLRNVKQIAGGSKKTA